MNLQKLKGYNRANASAEISKKNGFSIEIDEKSGLNKLIFPKGNYTQLADKLFLNISYFNGHELQEIIVPCYIKTIGNKCFKGCTGLERVIIPDSVTTIGEQCFSRCKNLMFVKLPRNIYIVPEALFGECLSLQNIDIPDGVEIIQDRCFSNCTGLKSITIPGTVREIGENAFSNCVSLESFIFNGKVECISREMFSGCENLEEVRLPDCLTKIDQMAFLGCYKLQSINLPYFMKKIGNRAFEDCYSLTEITIPSSVTQIGENGFYNCSNLKSISILPKLPQDKNTIEIQDNAFGECDKLEKLILAKGALDNENAFDFSNMPSLKKIKYCGKDILDLSDGEIFKNLIYNGKLIYVEYTNINGETVSKVLEDITSNRRDMRAIELTKRFKALLDKDVFKTENIHFISKERICLNLLTTIEYSTSLSLLDSLMEKRDRIYQARRVKTGHKNKLGEFLRRLFKKKTQNENTEHFNYVDVDDFLEILFFSPKIMSNVHMKEFSKFFNDNMTQILELNNTDEVKKLANIQKNFHVVMNNPIWKKKLQLGKLTLQEIIGNKSLNNIIDNQDEVDYVEFGTDRSIERYTDSKEH